MFGPSVIYSVIVAVWLSGNASFWNRSSLQVVFGFGFVTFVLQASAFISLGHRFICFLYVKSLLVI